MSNKLAVGAERCTAGEVLGGPNARNLKCYNVVLLVGLRPGNGKTAEIWLAASADLPEQPYNYAVLKMSSLILSLKQDILDSDPPSTPHAPVPPLEVF